MDAGEKNVPFFYCCCDYENNLDTSLSTDENCRKISRAKYRAPPQNFCTYCRTTELLSLSLLLLILILIVIILIWGCFVQDFDSYFNNTKKLLSAN